MQKIFSSKELLDFIYTQKGIVEASLLLNFNGRATHFITAKENLVFDEGIDGELVEWKKENFIKHYENSNWLIIQIA